MALMKRRPEDDWSETDRFTERTDDDDEDDPMELSPQLDELLMTLDDDPPDFEPKHHWVSCWGRFCYELNPCQNWFLVDDPPFTDRTLDIPASFAPTGPWPIMGKTTSLFSALAVLVWSIIVEDHKIFFLGYMHAWTLVFALLYMFCSLMNTIHGVPQPFSRASGLVRMAWFLFVVTAHFGTLEAIVYWATEFDPKDAVYDFRTLMLHGGVTLEVLLDGMTVNFIPLRWMHWWGCCLLPTLLYIGWTLIHAFFLWVGNPNENDRNTIYKIISWRFEWERTFMYMMIGVFVISPVVFAALWMMSLYKWFCCCCWFRERRKYLQTTKNAEKYREQALQAAAEAKVKKDQKDAAAQVKKDERDRKKKEKDRIKKEKLRVKEEKRRLREKEREIKEKEKERQRKKKKKASSSGKKKKSDNDVDDTAFLDPEDPTDSLEAGRRKQHSF